MSEATMSSSNSTASSQKKKPPITSKQFKEDITKKKKKKKDKKHKKHKKDKNRTKDKKRKDSSRCSCPSSTITIDTCQLTYAIAHQTPQKPQKKCPHKHYVNEPPQFQIEHTNQFKALKQRVTSHNIQMWREFHRQ
jgi:hypothetical protein